MHIVPTIPGVTLEVYKQDRRITPEPDGHLGQLFSGSAVILAVVDPKADQTVGILRDGQDHYTSVKELLSLPLLKFGRFPPAPAQQRARQLIAQRDLPTGSKVYSLEIPLRVDREKATNFVHYPENMLMVAQYVSDIRQPTDHVNVWKVALVSQNDSFFLTVQQAYSLTPHLTPQDKVCFPRLGGHHILERVLSAHVPCGFRVIPEKDFTPAKPPTVNGLKPHEGIVDRWYAARNMGCIFTAKGPARVHWSEVPARPRRRFLKAGERVRFTSLGPPPINPATERRKMRKSRFKLQAYGIELG